MVIDRQRSVRDIRAGLECQLRIVVPVARTTRCEVIIPRGGSDRPIQMGVIIRIRRKREVRAGLVVAEVAVLWVDKKSVS